MSKVKSVRLGDLDHDPVAIDGHEARLEQIDDLIASLPAKGQLQSLKVRPFGGKAPKKGAAPLWWVTAGNRRLATLRKLRDTKATIAGVVVTDDFPVHVIVSAEDDAAAYESSRSENLMRLPETPVEEFRAFAKMAKTSTIKEIAATFGVPEKRVQQRMKMAALHDDVLIALEKGKITMEAAQAFTIEPDPKKQAAYLKKAQSWDLYPNNIKQAFTQKLVRADSPAAKLIGREAYVAAGGKIMGDVFSSSSYWISNDVVKQLLGARFAAQINDWLADGWSFVETEAQYREANEGSIWQNRLEAMGPAADASAEAREAEINTLIAALEEQHPTLEDEPDESVPEDVVTQYRGLVDELDDLDVGARSFTVEQKAISGVVYWADLSRPPEFGVYRDGTEVPALLGGRAERKIDPAASLLDPGYEVDDKLTAMRSEGLALKVRADTALSLKVLLAQLLFGSQWGGVLQIARGFPLKEKYADFGAAFAQVRGMDDDLVVAELALMVGSGVKLSQHANVGLLVDDAGASPVFNAKVYFGKLKKPQLRAAWSDMRSPLDAEHASLPDGDIKDMAKSVMKLAAETKWLPPQLRSSSYVGPHFITPLTVAEDVDEDERDESQLQAAE